MNLSIPPKHLVGIDRNSWRIRRLAAFIAERSARGWTDAQLESYHQEFLRRIGGAPVKAGVVIKVDPPKAR